MLETASHNLFKIVIVALLGTAIPLRAAIIFSNLGPGDTYSFPQFTLGNGFTQGDAFQVAANDFILERVELAVGLVQGPNELDVWLMSDNGGEPGAVIETFHFSNVMGPAGAANPLLSADSVSHPILTAGFQYWLVGDTAVATIAQWNVNSIADSGPHALRTFGGPWTITGDQRGAFRISGTAVPETGTLTLFTVAMGGLLLCARRRPRACPTPDA
jgi:hypothetical protein